MPVAMAMAVALLVLASWSETTAAATAAELQLLRQAADLSLQRRHVWDLVASLAGTTPDVSGAFFEAWHGESEVFAGDLGELLTAPEPGMRGFARAGSTTSMVAAGVPVLEYTLYNTSAYEHIRRQELYLRTGLERLRAAGNRAVPAFPAEAIVLKTVWWPIARQGTTVLPVWDPQDNPPLRRGNGYTSWKRVVAVDPLPGVRRPATSIAATFAGQSFAAAERVGLDRFHHVTVDAALAARLMRDSEARKLALVALGRDIEAGDYLVLVGANLATREQEDWVWAAFWWHDQPDTGPFAADRPASISGPWRHFLMQVAFDPLTPTAVDGSPHICFNPWLEGRFPDQGQGGGTVSNCMACHGRASFPAVSFLPVTRGAADLAGDPAFAAGQLRTSFLWSLTLRALPAAATHPD